MDMQRNGPSILIDAKKKYAEDKNSVKKDDKRVIKCFMYTLLANF